MKTAKELSEYEGAKYDPSRDCAWTLDQVTEYLDAGIISHETHTVVAGEGGRFAVVTGKPLLNPAAEPWEKNSTA